MGEIVDAALILVIVFFCAILGFVQEYKAERALETLKKMLSHHGHQPDQGSHLFYLLQCKIIEVIVIELIVVLNSRLRKYSFFALNPHKWLVLSVISTLLFTFFIILIPAARESFGILLPSLKDMTIILRFGVFVLLTMELIKVYMRKTVYLNK